MQCFPFSSKDFRGLARIKIPFFWGDFPCLFPKKQGKEDQGLAALEKARSFLVISGVVWIVKYTILWNLGDP